MKYLYHYCSNQKCFNILKSKQLRMSDIRKSNDFSELELLFPSIFEVLLLKYKEKPFNFSYKKLENEEAIKALLNESLYWFNKRFETGDFSSFVVCFSKNSDCLSQWRGYAEDGKGCCLAITEDLLKQYCLESNGVLRYEEVTYLVEEGVQKLICDYAKDIIKTLKTLRRWIVKEMTHNDLDPDTDGLIAFNFNGMLENVFIDSLKYKSFSFNEENEVRIYLSNHAYKESKWIMDEEKSKFLGPKGFVDTLKFLENNIDFNITNDDIIPFCNLKLCNFKENIIKQIWFGPKNRIREKDMELYLMQNQYEGIEIKFSQIAYR